MVDVGGERQLREMEPAIIEDTPDIRIEPKPMRIVPGINGKETPEQLADWGFHEVNKGILYDGMHQWNDEYGNSIFLTADYRVLTYEANHFVEGETISRETLAEWRLHLDSTYFSQRNYERYNTPNGRNYIIRAPGSGQVVKFGEYRGY